MTSLLVDTHVLPELSPEVQATLRFVYALVMLAILALTLPNARRFFVSERWGGYAKSSRFVDAYQNPYVLPLLYVVWVGACVLLAFGRWSVPAAAFNLLVCRELFIRMRWSGALRGMGAPGFVAYWVGAAVFALELTTRYAPHERRLALLVVQVDFALIFLSAGVYKLLAGYRRNYGVDLGLVNPEWGYWWRAYRRLRPDHPLFVCLNQLGWATEVVAATLMLIPPTRFIGASIIFLTFAFVATQIRLGLLCEQVMVACLLFFHPGSAGARAVEAIFGWVPASPAGGTDTWLGGPLRVLLIAYLVLLPFAHLGLATNLYLRRSLGGPWQTALERYTNLFGIIVWRVFSVDVVGFFINVYRRPRAPDGPRELVSRWGWRHGFRYSAVAEAIAVTSVFTTLRYYASNNALFVERLLRYSRTVPHGPQELLVFEYVDISKRDEAWSFTPAAEFTVDVAAAGVEERVLDETVGLRVAHEHSPLHEAQRPGTYAPVRR